MAPSGLHCKSWVTNRETLYSGWLECKHFTALRVNLQDPDCIFPCLECFTCAHTTQSSVRFKGPSMRIYLALFLHAPSSSNNDLHSVPRSSESRPPFPQFNKPTVLCLGFLFLDYSVEITSKWKPGGSGPHLVWFSSLGESQLPLSNVWK